MPKIISYPIHFQLRDLVVLFLLMEAIEFLGLVRDSIGYFFIRRDRGGAEEDSCSGSNLPRPTPFWGLRER